MNLIDALKVNGKAQIERLDPKTHVCVENEMFIIRSTFDDGSTADAQLTLASMILSEEWVPFKEPCKHEPIIKSIISFTTNGKWQIESNEVMRLLEEERNPNCRYCEQKLKPTGWELA